MPFARPQEYVNRGLEIAINVGLMILLAAICFQILRPFLLIIAWGIIIAIAAYPAYRRLKALVGEHGNLAAILITTIFLLALIVPAVLLAGTLAEGIQTLTSHIKNDTLTVPPPPQNIANWPLIGPPIAEVWSAASSNLTNVLQKFAPQIRHIIPGVLTASAQVGLAILQFILSILVAGVLLANAQSGARVAQLLTDRLFGANGAEFEELAGSTIRSVTTGIIGVAFIQSVFAGIGFLVVGLPGAGLWVLLFLVAAILQMGALLLIPAVLYVFVIASTTKAVVFMIWCLIVGLMDNFLKPLLLGRGVAVPIAVVFLGAIGGFISMGIIGLFIGAIVLSVGYKLLLAWLGAGALVAKATEQPLAS